MRGTKHIIASGLLALASQTAAQVASICPETGVCFKLNIPENTASSGDGDIFFQISAPSSYEWVALGQGTSMSDSNIFVIYTSGDGKNVTLSPRTASGHSMPSFNGDAQVTLLEGSGVTGGNMVANVRCSNCNSWSSGKADFTSGNGNWIYGFSASGGPKNSDDTNAGIQQHRTAQAFQWAYANAKGGNSVNPLINAQPSGTSGGGGGSPTTSCVPRPANSNGATATATQTDDDSDDDDSTSRQWGRPTARPSDWTRPPWATGTPDNNKRHLEERQDINYCDDNSNNGFTPIGLSGAMEKQRKMLIAHGVLACLAFVIFFPAGAIAIRLASFPGVVWFHAAFQVFAYLVYIVAFGLGVYIASEMDMLDHHHPIIGIVVFVALFFQPVFGFLHHSLFKKYQARTFWSYAHIWLGRAVVTLGIINGGLGFQLADTMNMSSRSGMIAYGVIAGIVWLVWVIAIVLGEARRKTARRDGPPKYSESARGNSDERAIEEDQHALREIPRPPPENGHYAPKP